MTGAIQRSMAGAGSIRDAAAHIETADRSPGEIVGKAGAPKKLPRRVEGDEREWDQIAGRGEQPRRREAAADFRFRFHYPCDVRNSIGIVDPELNGDRGHSAIIADVNIR